MNGDSNGSSTPPTSSGVGRARNFASSYMNSKLSNRDTNVKAAEDALNGNSSHHPPSSWQGGGIGSGGDDFGSRSGSISGGSGKGVFGYQARLLNRTSSITSVSSLKSSPIHSAPLTSSSSLTSHPTPSTSSSRPPLSGIGGGFRGGSPPVSGGINSMGSLQEEGTPGGASDDMPIMGNNTPTSLKRSSWQAGARATTGQMHRSTTSFDAVRSRFSASPGSGSTSASAATPPTPFVPSTLPPTTGGGDGGIGINDSLSASTRSPPRSNTSPLPSSPPLGSISISNNKDSTRPSTPDSVVSSHSVSSSTPSLSSTAATSTSASNDQQQPFGERSSYRRQLPRLTSTAAASSPFMATSELGGRNGSVLPSRMALRKELERERDGGSTSSSGSLRERTMSTPPPVTSSSSSLAGASLAAKFEEKYGREEVSPRSASPGLGSVPLSAGPTMTSTPTSTSTNAGFNRWAGSIRRGGGGVGGTGEESRPPLSASATPVSARPTHRTTQSFSANSTPTGSGASLPFSRKSPFASTPGGSSPTLATAGLALPDRGGDESPTRNISNLNKEGSIRNSHLRSKTLPRLDLDPYSSSTQASAAGFVRGGSGADVGADAGSVEEAPKSAILPSTSIPESSQTTPSNPKDSTDSPSLTTRRPRPLSMNSLPKMRAAGAGLGVGGGEGLNRSATILMGPLLARGSRRMPSEVAEVVEEMNEGAARPKALADGEDVTGMHGRLRLSRQPDGADGSASLSTGASFPAGSNALKALEKQRHLLQAYEYLCHVGEAKEWLDRCLTTAQAELANYEAALSGHNIVELEHTLRDGVLLAKLARAFEGETKVPKIFDHPKLQFRHSDNINVFFNFIRKIGLPDIFTFELTDLYEAKNLPKVIYCLHALSHYMARKGMAQRVENLVGKLEFSQDQLENKQRGLDASGLSMPNFGGIGKALAKEINEVPEETEEDRIDRELKQIKPSIIALQSQVRGHITRQQVQTRLAVADSYVTTIQSHCRGALARRRFNDALDLRREIEAWTLKLQTAGRAKLAREAWIIHQDAIQDSSSTIVKVQAQIRGLFARREYNLVREALELTEPYIVGVQALARAALARQQRAKMQERIHNEQNVDRMIRFQAVARGALLRRSFFSNIHDLDQHEAAVTQFQAIARGELARKRYEALVFGLSEFTEEVIEFQARARQALARRNLLSLIRGLRAAEPGVIGLQSCIRGNFARKEAARMKKDLRKVEVTVGVGGLQAFARAALARKKVVEQKKELDFVAPDVVGFQAAVRGALVRRDYQGWRDYLHDSEPEAIFLQSLLRGRIAHNKYLDRLRHYHDHLEKVVTIQSVFRAKQEREQYLHLKTGKNVPVETIKNFAHLLQDSDFDYQEELEVESLKEEVVKHIRNNQGLEHDVNDLDIKIALLVKNKITLDEVARTRRQGAGGGLGPQRRNSVLAAAKDPFALATLDKDTRRKLELYQQLFYLLQTKPEYLGRLFYRLGRIDFPEKQRKVFEGVVLTLFGYAQNSREEFLLLKLLQRSVQEELHGVQHMQEFLQGRFMFINLSVQYARGTKERKFLTDLLTPLIKSIMGSKDSMETDPVKIYHACISAEETRTGLATRRPLDVNFHDALKDGETRDIFIKHLQRLRATTEMFLKTLLNSDSVTPNRRRWPFGLCYFAREILRALKERFPSEPEEALVRISCHYFYYRFVNPAVVAPEAFGIVEGAINPQQRANLAEVSKMLNQITVGRLFSDDNPYLQALNDYVQDASSRCSEWFPRVIAVADAEEHFHADEYLDHTVAHKPVIYISPNEIYTTHSLVLQHLQYVAPGHENPLRTVLMELGGAPATSSDELDQARAGEIALSLTNKFSDLRDPHAEDKALFVKTKRYVLSLLKVQHGTNLVETFLLPVTQENEDAWAFVIGEEINHVKEQQAKHAKQQRRKSMFPGGAAELHQLEDIRNVTFQELKVRTLENMLQLERLGLVTRENNYQDMLNAIANDIRTKHRKRIQRQNDIKNMNITLTNLEEKRSYLQDQIKSYHEHIDSSMATMQKKGKKKRMVLPFTPQYFHLRHLERTGKVPQFGSYKYTARRLHEKGVLISIEQHSAREFDNIHITISSDEVGVFMIECTHAGIPIPNGSIELRMEDLLERQFNNTQTININSVAKINLNLLLYLINRKFYV